MRSINERTKVRTVTLPFLWAENHPTQSEFISWLAPFLGRSVVQREDCLIGWYSWEGFYSLVFDLKIVQFVNKIGPDI